MTDAGGVLLSVRAEARQLVTPDYAVLDGQIEHTAESKTEAVQAVAATLDRLTADLAALGGVPYDEATGRSPLTWSHSSAAREERYHDKDTGRLVRSGQVTATVALRVVVRDLNTLEDLSGVLAAHPALEMHGVWWHVDCGPVDSEFDQLAGSAGGMTGGPPQLLRISPSQCAREALAGFDRGVPLVFPGRAYRVAMLPRQLSRRQAAQTARRLRSTAKSAAGAPDRPEGQVQA